MKLSQQSQAIIESAIQKAINKYTCGCIPPYFLQIL